MHYLYHLVNLSQYASEPFLELCSTINPISIERLNCHIIVMCLYQGRLVITKQLNLHIKFASISKQLQHAHARIKIHQCQPPPCRTIANAGNRTAVVQVQVKQTTWHDDQCKELAVQIKYLGCTYLGLTGAKVK